MNGGDDRGDNGPLESQTDGGETADALGNSISQSLDDGSPTLAVDGTPPMHAAPPSEDDDDWSRRVETDEVPVPSVTGAASRHVDDETVHHPVQPALTMKERLVQRERERRIETERARLKRQFALSNNRTEADGSIENGEVNPRESEDSVPAEIAGKAESVATLGEESTMVHPDEESSEQESRIGFNMERFLRNSESFNPQLESTAEDKPSATGNAENGGVLMERFLNEQRGAVGPNDEINTTSTDHHRARNVSFDVQEEQNAPQHVTSINVSIEATASSLGQDPSETKIEDLENMAGTHETPDALQEIPSSAQEEEPRVLFLTEADIQEMAAAETASIANAPPSERDDNLSEIGELADFPSNPLPRGDFSDTPTNTTAMDSASLPGSEKPPSAISSDRHSIDGAASANDTVAAQPPSEKDLLSPMMDLTTAQTADMGAIDDMKQPPLSSNILAGGTIGNHTDAGQIVNRRIRPGMVPDPPLPIHGTVSGADQDAILVDDFDFDKHDDDLKSDTAEMNDSFQNLPDDQDEWVDSERKVAPIGISTGENGYGAIEEGLTSANLLERSSTPIADGNLTRGEAAPLLSDVPPEIITRRDKSGGSNSRRASSALLSINQSIRSRLNSVFSDVRSEEEEEKLEIHNESEAYLMSSVFARAAPERIFALTITLLLEIPVLLMISGGSDALCELIGRRRYQLLVSFIPLTSAISGNVGLQASTLTTRAISHEHVTEINFMNWLGKEMGASCYLGAGMGLLLGFIAYIASEWDIPFGATILIAQFVSIVTAGCTGTLAPLLFSFIFKRDSGKWGGPLETAIQDIVGSACMVVMSYHILLWLGPSPIDPSDVCGAPSST